MGWNGLESLPLEMQEEGDPKVTGSTIAVVNETCGNLIQIAALDRWGLISQARPGPPGQ